MGLPTHTNSSLYRDKVFNGTQFYKLGNKIKLGPKQATSLLYIQIKEVK